MTYDQELKDRVYTLLQGFPRVSGKIELIAEVGSTVHNISAGNGMDDIDFTVVWTEDLSDLMAINPTHTTKMLRTAKEGERSGAGDIDLQVYSMRKFTSLCVHGNPSILNVLFVPEEKRLSSRYFFPATELAGLSHTKAAGKAFLGYVDAQMDRWVNHQTRRRVNRPELVAAHGYDTKYAAHAIRLAIQGQQFLDEGRIHIPMDEPVAGWLRQIRAGEVEEGMALDFCKVSRTRLQEALEHSTLPDYPDMVKVSQFLTNWHRGW